MPSECVIFDAKSIAKTLCHVHKEICHWFAEADIQTRANCSVPKQSSANVATCETAWGIIQ